LIPLALNQFAPNPIPLAVVAVNEPLISNRELAPKTIPAGFIRKRLEFPPLTLSNPLITEGSPPTTRPKIFLISGLERKLAIWSGFSPNCWKLWNRFDRSPDSCPPVILRLFPFVVTAVFTPSRAGTIDCDLPISTLNKLTNGSKHNHLTRFLTGIWNGFDLAICWRLAIDLFMIYSLG
jgi:hypothetical protein